MQARLLDPHICPATLGAPTPVTGPGMPTIIVCNMPAAKMTDMCPGVYPPAPHPIVKGSATVMLGVMPAARALLDPCALGGMVTVGAPTVLTGG